MVFALVGDSTMTSAVPPERARATTPLPLARLFRAAGALTAGGLPLSAAVAVLLRLTAVFPVFTAFFFLVAIASV
jgi:hypothetical protein